MTDRRSTLSGACVGHDPEWWSADEGTAGDLLAERLCQGCPLQVGCYNGALSRQEPQGRWGGVRFPLPVLELAVSGPVLEPWHGSDAGYKAHGCREVCCRVAHAKATAAYRLQLPVGANSGPAYSHIPIGGLDPTDVATAAVTMDVQLALFDLV